MREDIFETKDLSRLSELKNLLLHDVIEGQEKTLKELDRLEKTINNPDLLKKKISSILDDQTREMKQKFDELFGQEVTSIIKNSEPQLIQALTPIMGKLIQKWIVFEMGKVQSKVNEQIKNNPISGFFKNLFGRDTASEIISNVNTASIKDILVIQKETGFVMCNYSLENPINKNQVGGLITAIKAFGEDALKVGYKEEIVELRYDTYSVTIHNDLDYFAAILLNGHSSRAFTTVLKKTVGNFITKSISGQDFSEEIPEEELSNKLRETINEKVKC